MIVVGTYLLYAVEKAYQDDFTSQMKQSKNVFSEKDIEKNISENSPNYSDELFKVFKNVFVINNINRKGYLLDSFGKIILASDPADSQSGELTKTENLLLAMNGKIGETSASSGQLMDYAKPILVNNKVKYILYVKYNEAGLKSILSRLKNVIFYSVLSAFFISIILGYLLAAAITGPISNLTTRAQKMATGDFEDIIENSSGDEIGKLTDSFNYMAEEIKSNLNEISSEKSKIETILLHMTDGVLAFNFEGQIIHANPAAEKMLSISPQNNDLKSILRTTNLEDIETEISSLVNDEMVERQIYLNDKYYKIVFALFKSKDHKIGGIISVIQDVTEQNKLENMRREFVANVSHELKTPLTSIKTYTETLLEGAMEDKEVAANFLNVVHSESDRMSRIVSDLLQLSRLDYKEARWNKIEFELPEVVRDIVDKMKIEAGKKRQTIKFVQKEEIPQVKADKDGIVQVIINIISNAIKYTPDKGKINVELGKAEDRVSIKVIDNGMGIPTKDLPRIFERFYRVDKARSREMGGTGLGLSIAKEIVESNDGSIMIDSKLGKGTTVEIVLPVVSCQLSVDS
jgi:two-component system sensor histidine kinase VicK